MIEYDHWLWSEAARISIKVANQKKGASIKKELVPERMERLKEILRRDQIVQVQALCGRLKVSPATIRRYLNALEDSGELKRVHGGAVSTASRLEEPLFVHKTAMAVAEKQQIARAALEYIENNDTIYLDGGSTILELARLLGKNNSLTVVTNSISAAMELCGQGPRLILIGGELRRLSQTLVGTLTRLMLGEMYIDKAFMGATAVTLREGITTTDPAEAYTKELVMQQAGEVFLLTDSSKFGKVSFMRAGGLERVKTIITDTKIDKKTLSQLEKRKITVIRA
jgi:DeoR family transcriptional regulator, fructose operon transcriptional repressor